MVGNEVNHIYLNFYNNGAEGTIGGEAAIDLSLGIQYESKVGRKKVNRTKVKGRKN